MSDELTIVKVDTTPQSMKSWRELHAEDPTRYPVLLSLNRALDPFEVDLLTRGTAMIVGSDAMTVLLPAVTLEDVRDQLPRLTETINSCARRGREIRDEALAEDARLIALAAEITDSLRNP